MNPLTLSFVARTLNLPLPEHADPAAPVRVLTDSRQVQAGDVFVALAGEHHDAHDFVPEVLAKGARAVVSRADCTGLAGSLPVADTLAALQALAAARRSEIKPMVFGITGSSGKTTVKEMLAAVLRAKFGTGAVLATAGNFNNHIGLPLTLLNLNGGHRYAVIEMGMNHAGELAALTRIARPDAALVNNAMRAHIGCGFSGVDDIARAKAEIYQGLPENGVAVLPAEDANLPVFQAASAAFTRRTFGTDTGDVHAEHIVLSAFGSTFDLVCGGARAAVRLPAAGRHNVANAAAAAALALCAGLTLNDIADGLAAFATIKGRLQNKPGRHGGTVIDDTYNANPDSMKAALDVLAALPAPRVFVMGDMGELGEDEAPAMHAEVGAHARLRGIETACFVGTHSRAAAEAFGGGYWFADKAALLSALQNGLLTLPVTASVLVKGSRFMKMEEIVAALAAAD